MTISGWIFMISVGFNAAASVRVSNELGAGNPKSAAFSVIVVTMMSFIISVIAAVIVLCLRDYISYAFTEVGVPFGSLLGFKFGLGAKGIWGGMIGGTIMQTLILMWVTFRTDWNKEVKIAATVKRYVEEAKKRLNKWDGKKEEPLLS
ncbi:hypothetical protein C4D60_Mb02t14830 [Musa balbisiana]|uniref:Protein DETOXIFICATION n=1 Tax=Musa balbisiana TaxID=52838 RepID=A0A4S8IAV8_MUSBA|nr:hypothetical protein C4D60_Mb02t14830 [Musa balbisiana]